ncbi:MAG: hypothetical protein FWF90_17795 [Promicromonosporaceae bacterium]|nr:hypothetical protein [Promicromonosporaceae bacterium]
MPNYDQPVTSARQASEAVRALAHATTKFGDRPGDMFDVMGDMLMIVSSVATIFQNLARVHDEHAEHAVTDDDVRDTYAGRARAQAAARYLRKASRDVADSYTSADYALATTSHLIWQPDRTPRAPRSTVRPVPAARRANCDRPDGPSL